MRRGEQELHDDVGLMRAVELARQLGVSVWSIKRWVKQGKFPAPIYLQNGSPATWRVKDIKAHLDKCRRARRPKRDTRGGVLKQHRGGDA